MCHGIRKPRRLKVRRYAAPLVEHNEYVDSFLGSYAGKNIYEVESNDILLHRTTVGWDMQYFLQCFDFKVVPFKKEKYIFDCMDILESNYKVGV